MSHAEAVKEHLAALAAFPAALRQQVSGLSAVALTFRPAPGEWSVAENIGHLIDIDVLMAGRVGQIIAHDNPALQTLDVDEAVRKGDYQHKHVPFLLNSFAERRAALVEEWRFIMPANLTRAGIHPTRGPLTIDAIIAMVARHDLTHRDQIAATLEAAKTAA